MDFDSNLNLELHQPARSAIVSLIGRKGHFFIFRTRSSTRSPSPTSGAGWLQIGTDIIVKTRHRGSHYTMKTIVQAVDSPLKPLEYCSITAGALLHVSSLFALLDDAPR